MVLKIAWRSIARNRRRTVVTTGAMAVACAVMVFFVALMDGYMASMETNALKMELGQLQIHAPGYRKDPDLYKRIGAPDEIIEGLGRRGYSAAGRLYGFALAASKKASSGVQLRGVEVAREATVTRIHTHLLSGQWVDATDPNSVVIGRKLARTLAVGIGDEIVVLAQAADGSTANDLFVVRGILKTTTDMVDQSGVFMSAPAFRALMVVPEGVHEIVVSRKGGVSDLSAAVGEVAQIAKAHEVESWRQLQPMLARLLDTSSASLMVMLLIMYVAVAMVALNATLMSVFERIREFGVIRALGVGPWQVGGIVVAEAVFQVVLASAIAVLVGVPPTLYFQRNGMDLSAFGESASMGGIAMDNIWYPQFTAQSVVMPVAMLFIVVGVAVVYPGLKAALIRPVDAMRHR